MCGMCIHNYVNVYTQLVNCVYTYSHMCIHIYPTCTHVAGMCIHRQLRLCIHNKSVVYTQQECCVYTMSVVYTHMSVVYTHDHS